MRRTIILLNLCLFLTSCMTSAKVLTKVELGDTKEICINKVGEPESVSLKFKTEQGDVIEIWDYRLYQYKMATSLSPYFDIYSFIFVNGKLEKYEKTEKGSRLSESAALKLIGYPDISVQIK